MALLPDRKLRFFEEQPLARVPPGREGARAAAALPAGGRHKAAVHDPPLAVVTWMLCMAAYSMHSSVHDMLLRCHLWAG